MCSIWLGPRSRRMFGTILVFFVSSLVLVLLTNLLSALGARDFLDDLAHTAKTALYEMSPQQLALRFYVLQDPDPLRCSDYSAQPSYRVPARCSDWLHNRYSVVQWGVLGWLPIRWSWALIRLIGDIFAEGPVKAAIDILQLAAGSVIALTLFAWLHRTSQYPNSALGYWTIPAFILATLVFTTLLSLPILAIVFLGAKIVGEVVPTHPELELSFYGGSLGALFYACSNSLESVIHDALGRTLERAIGRWLK
jgi:hypothetical protein